MAIEVPRELPWKWHAGPMQRFASSPEDADMHVGIRVGRAELPGGESVRYDSGGGIFDVARDGNDWLIALRIRGDAPLGV